MQCCIGGHASVLSDYEKTGSSNILIHFHSSRLHLLDLLTKFGQNRIPPTLFNSPPPRSTPVNGYQNIHVSMRRRGHIYLA